ncbi:MAG: RES family NAD+ phosphorylase [Deltaproteobacteria bacterium]|nr:RES family NAD+ phosphorylase [Deltaproteobacteria bacterium]
MGRPADPNEAREWLQLLGAIAPRPFSGTAYRFIGSRFLSSPLSGAGSLHYGGRLNPAGAFEVLYTALAADTALAEREGILLTANGIKLARTIRTAVLLRIDCQLSSILDLTDEQLRCQLRITSADLLGPWLPWSAADPDDRGERAAPSQRLGAAVYASRRFEAIMTPSAKDPGGRCLAVFPDHLQAGSRITIDDPAGIIAGALGIAPARRQG